MFVDRYESMWVGKYSTRVLSYGWWVDWRSGGSPWDGFGVGHDDDERYARVIRGTPIYDSEGERTSGWRTRLPGVPDSQRDWDSLSQALEHMLTASNPRGTTDNRNTAFWELMDIFGVFA